MGRVCDCCGRMRPNERFGGRGQRARICSDCRTLPKATLQRNLAFGEIVGFLEQRNISQKNIARLKALDVIDDTTFQKLRLLILEIAQLAPRRRGRWKRLSSNNRDLLERAIAAGLIEDLRQPDEFEESEHDVLAEMRDPDDFDSFDFHDDIDSKPDAARSADEDGAAVDC